MRIYPYHLSQAHYCRKGARRFFLKHGLNWPAFLAVGIDAELLEATGDWMAQELVRMARNGKP